MPCRAPFRPPKMQKPALPCVLLQEPPAPYGNCPRNGHAVLFASLRQATMPSLDVGILLLEQTLPTSKLPVKLFFRRMAGAERCRRGAVLVSALFLAYP